MPSPSEPAPKQKTAAKSRDEVSVAAHLLAVSRSLSCGEVIILHTSEGVLRLTASAKLWESLSALVSRAPRPDKGKPGRPVGSIGGRGNLVGKGSSLTPERRTALEIQIARVKSGQATHHEAGEVLGMTRSAFTKWCKVLASASAPATEPDPAA